MVESVDSIIRIAANPEPRQRLKLVAKAMTKEALAKIAFGEKFDDFDARSHFGKLTYPAKDRRFTKIGPRG